MHLLGSERGGLAGGKVLLVSLFDGIGGARRSLDLLGIELAGSVSSEIDERARRVVREAFPDTEEVGDVSEMTPEWARRLSLKYPRTTLVLVVAGAPCQGVSRLSAQRKGLEDERSALHVHVARVKNMLDEEFTWCAVESLEENVASMGDADREVYSRDKGVIPLEIEYGDVVWVHRPRYYWVSWQVKSSEPGLEVDKQEGKFVLRFRGDKGPFSTWAEPGWEPAVEDTVFATFVQRIPKAEPWSNPPGLRTATPDQVERWKQDEHRYPRTSMLSVS